jgi:hypothetical protein
MEDVFASVSTRWRSFDYVCGFFFKAAEYIKAVESSSSAFVSTNSVSQGVQVAEFWPLVLDSAKLGFARTSFKWSNLAANNAGVTCVVIGLCANSRSGQCTIFDETTSRKVVSISPYMVAGDAIFVKARPQPISDVSAMLLGNFAKDGGNLICDYTEIGTLDEIARRFLRPMFGGQEFIDGLCRYCFWISDEEFPEASKSHELRSRFALVRDNRRKSPKKATVEWSAKPFRFVEIRSPNYEEAMVIPIVSSENRPYLPVGLLPRRSIVNYAFGMYDAPLWNMALIASRLHLVWVATVCGKKRGTATPTLLEHFSGPDSHREEQSRPHAVR